MDTDKREVLDASESPQQEETVMEKEGRVETPDESTEPENPPAAVEETGQLAVNGHATEVVRVKEAEELPVAESAAQENAEIMAEEKSDVEPAPCAVAQPEPDESSEKASDSVAAVDEPPQNTEQQQPLPENSPEPLQTHLAEAAPEPEPEKVAEPVHETEPQAQTSPEPAVVQQAPDTQPPTQEEKVPEKVEADKEPGSAMEPEARETVQVTEVSPEKPAEKGAPAQVGSGEPAEPETKAEPGESETKAEPGESETKAEPGESETKAEPGESETKAEPGESETKAEPGESETKAEPVESESAALEQKQEPEPQKEEETAPATGSLSFAILEREQTKDALRTSRILVVLRGLPGSGKSFLARAIADAYKDQCSVFCADDHGIKPEKAESSADGFRALDEAVAARCREGAASPLLIVVDDTNLSHHRLARLGEIAKEHHFICMFVEPQTEWSRDVAQLKNKTKRGLEEAQLETLKGQLLETSIPLYFGWFLMSSVEEKVRCTSMDFLKTLDTLDAFKKHMSDFTGKAEKEVDLEQYFESKGILHCTTKFCNYGKADGAKEYAQNSDVINSYGSAYELSLTALFVTPRTVGARVSLSEEQLLLWPAEPEKQAEAAAPAAASAAAAPAAASLPPGSRAHVTLGCAEGVEPVQTGLDLLQILALPQGELVEEMELGSLTYYGEGRWLLALREPIRAPALFSSFYEPKELEPAKKEPEKKKKAKCSIL
ncbi:uncharacterized protein cnp isoform 1-T2 [Menidia menidia]